MQLIDNLRQFFNFWSVRFAGIQQATILFWATCVPTDFKTPANYHWFELVVALQGGLILLARAIKQEPVNAGDVAKPPPGPGAPPVVKS